MIFSALEKRFDLAWLDICGALKNKHIFTTLGWQDIATRYKRSRIGAFWLTINVLVLITVLGFVFGTLFKASINDFLPHLALGMIIWFFLSNVINESCTGFVDARETILQIRMPLSTHIFKIVWRNLIILAHNVLIIPLLFLFIMKPVGFVALLSIPGLIILTANVSWMAIILAIVCSRYRDLTQIVQNLMQIFFYVTPIIWSTGMLPDRLGASILNINPFYHLLSIVRDPLLNQYPTTSNWLISVLMAVIGWLFALVIFRRFYKKVAYWI